MSLRKRLRDNHSEVDAAVGPLNDVLFILLMFFLLISTLANPNVVKVNNPKGKKRYKGEPNYRGDSHQRPECFYRHTTDRYVLYRFSVEKSGTVNRKYVDTPTVVLNVDTAAYYGKAFRIMEAAKRAKAKLAANIK